MAHELSFKNNQAELLLADTGAWHRLGQIVQGAFSASDAIQQVIPWTALDLALYAHAPCDSPQAALAEQWGSKFFKSDKVGIFRSDTGAHIGTVGASYAIIQPVHMFDFVDTMIEGSGFHYDSAGALRGGSVLFISARVGQIDVLGSGDVTRTYLAFINSFDGSLAAQAYLTGTRIVCMNTLQFSLGNVTGTTLRFKHTKNVHHKMHAAHNLVQGVLATQQDLQTKLETLAQRKIIKRERYTAILDSLFPGESTKSENIKRDITALWSHNDGNAFPWEHTAYALYNAVTNYVDHSRATRGDDRATSRAESAILGSGAALKAKALEQILVLTDGTEEHVYPSAGIPDSVDAFLDGLDSVDDID
jgi:phage/plasmid-like protein (TIGR03299 family)